MKYIKLLNPLPVLYVLFFTVSKHLGWHTRVPAIKYFISTAVRKVYWKIKPLATASEFTNQMWHTDTAPQLSVFLQRFSCCLHCVSFEGGYNMSDIPDTSFPDLNEEDPVFCLPPLKAQTDMINFCPQTELCMNHTRTHTHPLASR